jgi:hypothetical protein
MSVKLKADINAARQTICSAISDWTKRDYSYGDPIPTMVNGTLTGRLQRSLLTQFEPIEKIVRPAMLAMPPNNEELKSLKKLIKRSELTIRDMEHLSDTVRSKVVNKADNLTNLAPSETTMQEQIIAAIGTIQAADIALKRLCGAANEVISESQPELIKSRGRPKDKVAHTIAYEFARLYYDITEELPTYADGASGPSGSVSPKLAELFEKLGIKADIRSPLDAAIEQISAEINEPT